MQRRAQAKAAELGISFAEYVRRVIADDLGQPGHKVDISAVFDLGASREATNVARDKHRMLDEAAWEDYQRKTGRTQRGAGRAKAGRR